MRFGLSAIATIVVVLSSFTANAHGAVPSTVSRLNELLFPDGMSNDQNNCRDQSSILIEVAIFKRTLHDFGDASSSEMARAAHSLLRERCGTSGWRTSRAIVREWAREWFELQTVDFGSMDVKTIDVETKEELFLRRSKFLGFGAAVEDLLLTSGPVGRAQSDKPFVLEASFGMFSCANTLWHTRRALSGPVADSQAREALLRMLAHRTGSLARPCCQGSLRCDEDELIGSTLLWLVSDWFSP
jgi:hypothetical protein